MLCLLLPSPTRAHIGSPDVFYDGKIGPWPAHITIRMPTVVPGQAEILAQIETSEPVTVSAVPLFARTAISNAPPPEMASPVRGQTNLFAGTMWLMTMGAYSIEVRARGASGEGLVQIPVNSVATAQLPLPPALGAILLALGLLLFCGAVSIIAAAAGESTVAPGALPTPAHRRKYWVAGTVSLVVLTLGLLGGKKWWDAEERSFRGRLHDGGWPDLSASVRRDGQQRILQLTLGKRDFNPRSPLPLATDHGKLLHLFLVRQPDRAAFGHIHPVRTGNNEFEVALPPLPEGDYALFCDLTLESGLSSTATNVVYVPPLNTTAAGNSKATNVSPDLDDTWAQHSGAAPRDEPGTDTVGILDDGTKVIWKTHPSLRARADAALRFEVFDPSGQPAVLQPYMGMLSHAAVLRSDGRIFAHLHPSGNFSMAAQMFFDDKIKKETGAGSNLGSMAGMQHDMPGMDHSMMMEHSIIAGETAPHASTLTLPYQFPTPGDYRLWVQIKTHDRVQTAIFDAVVE